VHGDAPPPPPPPSKSRKRKAAGGSAEADGGVGSGGGRGAADDAADNSGYWCPPFKVRAWQVPSLPSHLCFTCFFCRSDEKK